LLANNAAAHFIPAGFVIRQCKSPENAQDIHDESLRLKTVNHLQEKIFRSHDVAGVERSDFYPRSLV